MSPTSHPITLAVPPEPTDHSQGSDHARVVVVEYGDFEYPSCKVAATTPSLLMERFPNQVRFVFRHFPLEEAHPHPLLAAEASEAAGAKGTNKKGVLEGRPNGENRFERNDGLSGLAPVVAAAATSAAIVPGTGIIRAEVRTAHVAIAGAGLGGLGRWYDATLVSAAVQEVMRQFLAGHDAGTHGQA